MGTGVWGFGVAVAYSGHVNSRERVVKDGVRASLIEPVSRQYLRRFRWAGCCNALGEAVKSIAVQSVIDLLDLRYLIGLKSLDG